VKRSLRFNAGDAAKSCEKKAARHRIRANLLRSICALQQLSGQRQG